MTGGQTIWQNFFSRKKERRKKMGENFLADEKLVHGVIRRKFGRVRGEELKDIEQAGRLGLVKAAEKFKAEKGVSFSTYAEKCIENEIREYYRREKIRERLAVESLGAVIGKFESDDVTWEDVLEDESLRVEEILERKEIRLIVYKEAEAMKGRKREIIKMWLRGGNGAEIGRVLGISKQRVHVVVQEYKRALKKKLAEAEIYVGDERAR